MSVLSHTSKDKSIAYDLIILKNERDGKEIMVRKFFSYIKL